MNILRRFAALLLCAPAACAPIVTHGPRPERGLQLTATVGVPQELCDTSCVAEFIPQLGVGMRTGRPSEGGRMGYSVGATFSASIVSSEIDVYLQAPTAPRWDAGGGLLLSPMHVMPYVQLGRMHEDGSGFYTTQGFALLAERNEWSWDGENGPTGTPRYWSPTVAYRFARRGGAVHLYLSGAFGTMDLSDEGRAPGQPPRASAPVRQVMAGIAVERTVRTPVMLGPPLTRPTP